MSTGPIAYARADLAAALRQATDLPVLTSVPERLDPPCVVITEGTPVLEADETGPRGVTVHLTATVVEAPTDAALALERLDAHVDQITTTAWGHVPLTVTSYSTVTSADSQHYLAAAIETTTNLTI